MEAIPICKPCGHTFFSMGNYRRHYKKKHVNEENDDDSEQLSLNDSDDEREHEFMKEMITELTVNMRKMKKEISEEMIGMKEIVEFVEKQCNNREVELHDLSTKYNEIVQKYDELFSKYNDLLCENARLKGENNVYDKLLNIFNTLHGSATSLSIESNIDNKKIDNKKIDSITNNTDIHPNIINNISITIIKPFSDEYIQNKVDKKYTYDVFLKGEEGLMDFIENITTKYNGSDLERNYVCTDDYNEDYYKLTDARKWMLDKGGKCLNKLLDVVKDKVKVYDKNIDNDKKIRRREKAKAKELATNILSKGRRRDELFERTKENISNRIGVDE